MTCKAKHVYDPKHWYCPKCGQGLDEFHIDSDDENASGRCVRLHAGDTVVCDSCNRVWSGRAVSRLFMKRDSMTKCSCCKGTGFVKKEMKT